MNFKLRDKIASRVPSLYSPQPPEFEEEQSKVNCYYNDPIQLLTFIETNVTSREAIWNSVAKTLSKARLENAKLGEGHFVEAEFRLEAVLDNLHFQARD